MLPEGAALAIISAMRTKSKSISEILRQEIVSGKFDAAGKLPSEHQLMRRFSVARETVRGALKDLTDRELVDRRPGYGTFLADHASRLATQRFGVMVPDAFHPFYGGYAADWRTAREGTDTPRSRRPLEPAACANEPSGQPSSPTCACASA